MQEDNGLALPINLVVRVDTARIDPSAGPYASVPSCHQPVLVTCYIDRCA